MKKSQYIVTTKNGKKRGIANSLTTAKKMAKAIKETTGENCTIDTFWINESTDEMEKS